MSFRIEKCEILSAAFPNRIHFRKGNAEPKFFTQTHSKLSNKTMSKKMSSLANETIPLPALAPAPPITVAPTNQAARPKERRRRSRHRRFDAGARACKMNSTSSRARTNARSDPSRFNSGRRERRALVFNGDAKERRDER